MRGIILLNVGTPAACDKQSVERFISDMLSDPLVVDKFQPAFKILARYVIAPLSASKSLGKYSLIWRKGEPAISPILYYMQKLAIKIEQQKDVPVEIAMRYGSPSIESAFEALSKKCNTLTDVVIFPLMPHYAQSSTQTANDEVCRVYNSKSYPFKIKFIEPYYNHPAFINALATQTRPYLTNDFDRLVFSYHSLPVYQVENAWRKGKEYDYVYQLKETNQLLNQELGINPNKTLLFYSSQRGKNWLSPFLDKDITDLPKLGWKKIVALTPGFPVDNLETLFDVDIEARNLFMKAGGEEFIYVPALNAEDHWVDAIWKIISTS